MKTIAVVAQGLGYRCVIHALAVAILGALPSGCDRTGGCSRKWAALESSKGGLVVAQDKVDAGGIRETVAGNQVRLPGVDPGAKKQLVPPCESQGPVINGLGAPPAACAPPDFDDTYPPSPRNEGERW